MQKNNGFFLEVVKDICDLLSKIICLFVLLCYNEAFLY